MPDTLIPAGPRALLSSTTQNQSSPTPKSQQIPLVHENHPAIDVTTGQGVLLPEATNREASRVEGEKPGPFKYGKVQVKPWRSRLHTLRRQRAGRPCDQGAPSSRSACTCFASAAAAKARHPRMVFRGALVCGTRMTQCPENRHA
jgi:hypothetical protein